MSPLQREVVSWCPKAGGAQVGASAASMSREETSKMQDGLRLKSEGNVLFKAGKFEAALTAYEQALSCVPCAAVRKKDCGAELTWWNILSNMAATHKRLGQHEQVIAR